MAKSDAMEGQREVEGTHVKYWKEKCEIMKSTAVPVASIDAFLDYMHDCYEGMYCLLMRIYFHFRGIYT